jgi:hypothetical protein
LPHAAATAVNATACRFAFNAVPNVFAVVDKGKGINGGAASCAELKYNGELELLRQQHCQAWGCVRVASSVAGLP